ncbi:MAG: NADH-quinone oxidoreductase subunit NuoE [Lysobacterales bacterium]
MKARGDYDEVKDVDPLVALTDATRARIDHWVGKFPPERRRSALIQGLIAAQEQNGGWLTDGLITAVAKYLEVPPVWAYEVSTFYSMLETHPVGRHNVAICTNISCWLNGADAIVRHCEKRLGVKLGDSTPDGRIYLKKEEECLAACCGAPMMAVDGHYHERLTPEKVDAILDALK